MRLIYVVSLSHPTLLYHKDHTYMKGSAWFETFAAIFMFLHISIANCLQNYRKKTKQQNFYRKSFEKSYVREHNRKKESYLRNMILPTKGMRLEGSLERSTQAIKNQQIYARINLFSRKKYQSLIFGYKIRVISLIHNTFRE
jgi:hypothetical protein